MIRAAPCELPRSWPSAELLDQKDGLAPPSEMISGRRAHRAGTDDHITFGPGGL